MGKQFDNILVSELKTTLTRPEEIADFLNCHFRTIGLTCLEIPSDQINKKKKQMIT